MNPTDLAYALWNMFAVGAEAQRYDDRVRARYEAKAQRVIEIAERNAAARDHHVAPDA